MYNFSKWYIKLDKDQKSVKTRIVLLSLTLLLILTVFNYDNFNKILFESAHVY